MPPRRGRRYPYELVLGQAAGLVIERLEEHDRRRLVDALKTELLNGPNAHNEIRFDPRKWADTGPSSDGPWTATPLNCGFAAVHRPLTKAELDRLAAKHGRPLEEPCLYVVDILSLGSIFGGGPHPV
jgi:hypothetical protein